jgi:hypothetical protein
MSTASVAAAKIYIHMQQMDGCVNEAFMTAPHEPYRAAMDASREIGIHSIVDGSEDYAECVDCLEVLICN